ncbi:MAG: hypothetical protein AAF436_13805 [Myxococcota bacterium]
MRRFDRPWVWALGTVVVLGLVLGGRSWNTARHEWASGQAAEADGRDAAAIGHYRRAMRWTFPLNAYPDRAATALESVALRLEANGDVHSALLAWRSVAGSEAATRSFWAGSSSERRDRALAQIERLVAQRPASPAASDPGQDAVRTTDRARSRASVSLAWAWVLLLGFAVWLAGLWLTVTRGFDPSGRLRWTEARTPFTGAVLGLAAFVLGMLFA